MTKENSRQNSKKSGKTEKKKNTARKDTRISKTEKDNRERIKDEIAAILIMVAGIFLTISLHTHFAGTIGTEVSNILKGLFGHGAFIAAYFLMLYSLLIFADKTRPFKGRSIFLLIIMFLFMVLINGGRFVENMKYGPLGALDVYKEGIVLKNGGIFAMYAGSYIAKAVGLTGMYLISTGGILICLLLLINTPFSKAYEESRKRKEVRAEEKLKKQTAREKLKREKLEAKEKRLLKKEEFQEAKRRVKESRNRENVIAIASRESNIGKNERKENIEEGKTDYEEVFRDDLVGENNFESFVQGKDEEKIMRDSPWSSHEEQREKMTDDFSEEKITEADKKIGEKKNYKNYGKNSKYKMPPLSILNSSGKQAKKKSEESDLKANAKRLEDTLKSFNVDAKVINVTKGSSVTRYEIQPAVGVKVASIVRLTDDIALNLRAGSIRMEAPIPGKAAVGIEVENSSRETVRAGDIFASREFRDHPSKLGFAVGKDIGGKPVIGDLGKMPHLLIAGATGSGKSVCINMIISGILYKAHPEEVKLVLIDPKMVELGAYNGIPHLLIPVVTDSKKAAAALNWAVAEMTERYKKFASSAVRDMESYNDKMRREGREEEILPKIVIIIDELADLMMVASSQVEDAICRLAQLARAAGMHLIVATQRPSVDVITGLIKANIPSRIAFMVSSQIDSRTILDMPGAEKLVGNGDMLFKPQNLNKPVRIQGPFISDGEVHKLIDFVSSQGGSEENLSNEIEEKIKEGLGAGQSGAESDEEDELMEDAVLTVLQAEQASVSMLQRRFRIGYNRAARIIDLMEERGIVGPQDGSRPRTVLLTLEEYETSKAQEE